jgi:hypothetical protein
MSSYGEEGTGSARAHAAAAETVSKHKKKRAQKDRMATLWNRTAAALGRPRSARQQTKSVNGSRPA